jgi:hypothetical protein
MHDGRTGLEMSKAIRPEHLELLRPLEVELKRAVKAQEAPAAEAAMSSIQKLLEQYGASHHRLLECRLWYFESQFDANHITTAESGFLGISKRAREGSRLFLEASFFLALCHLRQKRKSEAKQLIRKVLGGLNKIPSPDTRHLLQKRIIDRVEQESVLTSLIGVDQGPLRPEQIHDEAVQLVQKSDGELFELLARALPYGSIASLEDIRSDALLQLSAPDRKLLPAPGQAIPTAHIGKLVFAVLKRVGWKTLCAQDSPLYKLWSKRIPAVYSTAYFATSITQTFNDWKIGLPFLAAGVAAIAMKYGAQEFCELTKPDSIMDARRKKASKSDRGCL